MPGVVTLKRLKQGDYGFRASLGYFNKGRNKIKIKEGIKNRESQKNSLNQTFFWGGESPEWEVKHPRIMGILGDFHASGFERDSQDGALANWAAICLQNLVPRFPWDCMSPRSPAVVGNTKRL